MLNEVKSAFASIVSHQGYATTSQIYKKLTQDGVKITPFQVSQTLKEEKIYYVPGSNPRRWSKILTAKSQLKAELLNFITMWDHSKPVTTKVVRKYLGAQNVIYTKKEFEYTFGDFFEFTGVYNRENHKQYRYRKPETHFSESKGEVMDINEMHPDHIYKTIQKKYPHVLVKDVFTRSSEIFQLLKAYFIYDIKMTIKTWLK